MDEFAHLHVHTDYSILDGAARIPGLIKEVQRLGQPAVAITDHGNPAGAFQLWKEATAVGVKPIIGMEAYISPGSMTDRSQIRWGTEEQRDQDVSRGAYTHLTLLAKDATGLRNLWRLYALSYELGFHYKPRIDLETVAAHSQGLIVLTGCLGGELQTRLKLGQLAEGKEYLERMRSIFQDRLYVEIMDHDIPDEKPINPQLIELSKEFSIPLVATNDSHYVSERDHYAHDALLCVQTGQRINGNRRFKFEGTGYYLKSAAEMSATFKQIPEALKSTLGIAERVEDYSEVFAHSLRMPHYSNSEDEDLSIMVYDGLREGGRKTPAHFAQAEYELGVIASQGYSGYFLVAAKAIDVGRQNGRIIGPGRGSAPGSLVSNALGLTLLDPLDNGLLFERFLNPSRVSLPDIDFDISENTVEGFRRDLSEAFGRDKVARIGTLSTIGARAAIKDATRVLGLPISDGECLARALPPMLRGRAPKLDEIGNFDKRFAPIYDLAIQLEGNIRGMGQHAAGMVISPQPLADILPILISDNGKGEPTTAFTMGEVEAIGLVKYDFLSLRNLDIIDDCLRFIGKDWSYLPQRTQDCNDPEVLKLYSKGETIGVFQADSGLMQSLFRSVRADAFGDVSAVLALARPGPLDAGTPKKYAARKNGREPIDYIHPEFEEALSPILGETYGLIVYQEQVLKALSATGGYDYASAGLIFDAMRKKNTQKMLEAQPEFERRLTDNGYSETAIHRLWETLVPFSDYSFNKSHTASYGLISYWTAYLKVRHPTEYLCALLTSTATKPEHTALYLQETQRMGVPILTPDVNSSAAGWSPSKEGIHYGLSTIQGVGPNAQKLITRVRPVSSLDDFFTRADQKLLNIGILSALTKGGAFDSVCHSREGLFQDLESLSARATSYRNGAARGEPPTVRVSLSASRSPRDSELRARWELDVLGVAITQEEWLISATRSLSVQEIEYLSRVCQENPGGSSLSIKWNTSRDTNSVSSNLISVDRQRVEKHLKGMGVFK